MPWKRRKATTGEGDTSKKVEETTTLGKKAPMKGESGLKEENNWITTSLGKTLLPIMYFEPESFVISLLLQLGHSKSQPPTKRKYLIISATFHLTVIIACELF